MRAYARHRKQRGLPGAHLSAIQFAVKSRRIPVHQIGDELFIDPAEADAAWSENTQPAIERNGGGLDPSGADAHRGNGGGSYADARAEREKVELELKRLKLEEARGNLVDAEQVRREAFETARAVRERLGSLPSRLASLVMATAATGGVRAVEELIASEIHEALKALAGGEAAS